VFLGRDCIGFAMLLHDNQPGSVSGIQWPNARPKKEVLKTISRVAKQAMAAKPTPASN